MRHGVSSFVFCLFLGVARVAGGQAQPRAIAPSAAAGASSFASAAMMNESADGFQSERLRIDQERLRIDRESLELEKQKHSLERRRFESSEADRASTSAENMQGLERWSKRVSIAQAMATILGILIGAIWALQRFRREREAHPHIEFSADVTLVETRSEWYIVELLSIIENKGKVLHKMGRFEFDLYALLPDDVVETEPKYGGQVHFPHKIAEGSWLPTRYKYFFVEPQVRAKYSFVARVPKQATSIILHSWFDYADGRHSHSAERTIACSQLAGNTRLSGQEQG